MDSFPTFTHRNPNEVARTVGMRLKTLRLSKGWTQEELASRSGIALSTLKLLESTGKGSFQRLIRVAIALGIEGDILRLFAETRHSLSNEARALANRRRAPRRQQH